MPNERGPRRRPRPGDDSPYLTVDEAAIRLRYSSAGALRQAIKPLRIPHVRRGRKIFFVLADLDAFMRRGSKGKRT